jgi:uncharacterized peroxidase-related enzyme
MRLGVLEHGQRWGPRFLFGLARFLTRKKPDEVAMTSMYRPSFFGRPWIALLREVMRGPSAWSPGERELFGAFVSRLNRCPYCIGVHTGTATIGLGRSVTVEALDSWRDGTFGPRLTPVLALLERVTLEPAVVGREDVDAARSAGVTDEAIIDALYVAFVFNIVNRLANAFGYSWETEAERLLLARTLDRIGYRVPGFLLR